MKRKSMKRISMLLATLMIVGSAAGCGTKKEAPASTTESSSKVATSSENEKEKEIDENTLKDTYTGIGDVYVLQGAKGVDYLSDVLYDSSIVKDIAVDTSKVDTTKEGSYKITYNVTVDRVAFDEYSEAKAAKNDTTAKTSTDKTTTDKTATDKTSTTSTKVDKEATVVDKDEAQDLADKDTPVKSGDDETVKKSDGSEVTTDKKAPTSTATTDGKVVDASTKKDVTETVTVVDKDKAQELADKNKPVQAGNGETVKKSDGTDVKTEQKAPASTATTDGKVVDASNKAEVKPDTVAEPTKEPTKETASSSDGSNSGNSSSTESGSTGSTGSSNDTGNTGNTGGSNGGSGSSSTPVQTHTHSWETYTETIPAVTHQEPVYGQEQYVVRDAWDEQVETNNTQECSQCGYRSSDPEDMGVHCFKNGHSCHNVKEYQTIHHDAEYGTRTVQTGTTTVVDREAQTVTHRRCTSCGASE